MADCCKGLPTKTYYLDEPEPTKPVVIELIVAGCDGLACGSVNAGER